MQGRYVEALEVITEKNPLPFITGTICAHHCMDKCTRNFYDRSVQIRDAKLTAAEKGFDGLMAKLQRPAKTRNDLKVAFVGGGPTGMAAAYFLARAGAPVTLFEKADQTGRHCPSGHPCIPDL